MATETRNQGAAFASSRAIYTCKNQHTSPLQSQPGCGDGVVEAACPRQIAVGYPLLVRKPPEPLANLCDGVEVQNDEVEPARKVRKVAQTEAMFGRCAVDAQVSSRPAPEGFGPSDLRRLVAGPKTPPAAIAPAKETAVLEWERRGVGTGAPPTARTTARR